MPQELLHLKSSCSGHTVARSRSCGIRFPRKQHKRSIAGRGGATTGTHDPECKLLAQVGFAVYCCPVYAASRSSDSTKVVDDKGGVPSI
jgi:hypothetical protein